MGNCLVTKLKENVNNNDLQRLGCLLVKAKAIDPTAYASNVAYSLLTLKSRVSTKIEIVGDGGMNTTKELLNSDPQTELTIAANTTTYLYFSNGTYNVFIHNKYNITTFSIVGQGLVPGLFNLNFDDICYCTSLTNLSLNQAAVEGDITKLQKKNYEGLTLSLNQELTGDISDFTVSGSLNIGYNKIYGNFTNVLKNTTNPGQPFTAFKRDGVVSVDLSYASDSVRALKNTIDQDVICSWTTTRSSSKHIIALDDGGVYSFNFGDDLDSMLINQADCIAVSGATGSNAMIAVTGNRTSASDAAVATLKSKGYTVRINRVTL